MYTVAEIVVLAHDYLEATGVPVARLSAAATGNPKTIGRLFDGEDCYAASLERASLWFPPNWPLHVPWPEAVPRPFGRWRLELRLHGPPPPDGRRPAGVELGDNLCGDRDRRADTP